MTLKYPKSLDENNSPYIKITCYNWTSSDKRNQNAKPKTRIIDSIFLPISKNGITENRSMDWDQSQNVDIKTFSSFVQRFAATKISNLLPEDVTNWLKFNYGGTLNDFSALTFIGNNFRDLSLSWDFYPSSRGEAATIKKIIRFFERNGLPIYNGWKIEYPNLWNVGLYLPDPILATGVSDIKIFDFQNCVITDFTKNYFQNEDISSYYDGNINSSMSITFKELRRLGRK